MPEIKASLRPSRNQGIRRATNPWIETAQNVLHSPSAVLGLILVGALVVIAIAAPLLATHDPLLSMIGQPGETGRLQAKPPCVPVFGCEDTLHFMGLDLNGRDLFSRIVYGTRTSLTVGMLTISLSSAVGTLVGLAAGYAGGRTDNVIMRIMDVIMAFPALLLAISIVTILGPGLTNALLGITITYIPQYARLIRAGVLSLKEQEFITAEHAVGAGALHIVFIHILPNAITPVVVQATLGIGSAILDAAALSFLGLGAQPPMPEWGQILSESRNYVFTSPHLVFFPGIAIIITVLGFNLLGDGLRDALDPRLNRN